MGVQQAHVTHRVQRVQQGRFKLVHLGYTRPIRPIRYELGQIIRREGAHSPDAVKGGTPGPHRRAAHDGRLGGDGYGGRWYPASTWYAT